MPVLSNIRTLYICPIDGGQGNVKPIHDGALAWQNDTISWVGKSAELPQKYSGEQKIDAGGGIVIPGLIDCHTHLAFGGWREDEFVRRIKGETYLDIAKSGGGIARTVDSTRKASPADLKAHCLSFLNGMQALGVTTVECKSGYGLSLESELMLLETYNRLRTEQPLRIVSTFLGAHTVPKEMKGARADYVKTVIEEMLPEIAVKKLASFCDVFVEDGAFTIDEAKRIFAKAKELGLGLKIHADQLSHTGGAELAGSIGAISADHLEYISDEGIMALAKADTVAVMLPWAALHTNVPPLDAQKLVRAGVKVAVATDFNPGTSPTSHLPFVLGLSCLVNRLTPEEALKAATIYAAQAISRQNEIGSLEVGKRADFAVLDADSVNHWLYQVRANCCRQSYIGGDKVHG